MQLQVKHQKEQSKKFFLEEFEKRVKAPVRANTDLLRKIGWE